MQDGGAIAPAPIWRRLLAMLYEALLVMALLLLASLIFQGASTLAERSGGSAWRLTGWLRAVYQVYLVLIMSAYFGWFWQQGQTLAMRAWRLRLIDGRGKPPRAGATALRFVGALVFLGPSLIGLLWLREHPSSVWGWLGVVPALVGLVPMAFDAQRRALYDRIAATRMVLISAARPTTSSRAPHTEKAGLAPRR